MDTTYSTAARYRVRSAVRLTILARIRLADDRTDEIKALLGVSDGAIRGWKAGTMPSFVKAQHYAPLLGMDPTTGRAVSP